jgi:hypothetical protein
MTENSAPRSDQAAAQQWFNVAWHQRVRKTYGVDASIEWFDTPILLPSKAASNSIAMFSAQR